MLLFLLSLYLGVELLGYMVTEEIPDFSKVAAPFYIPDDSM